MLVGLLLSFFLNPTISHSAELLKIVALNFNDEQVPEDPQSEIRDIRFQVMSDWIKSNQPDIVFIAEGWNYHGYPSVVIPLAEATGYRYTYRLTMGVNGILLDSDGVLVKNTFHWDEEMSFKLPHSSASLGDGKTWIVSLGASSWGVGGRVTTPAGNPLYLYATHLIAKTDAQRGDGIMGLHAGIEGEISDRGESIDKSNIFIAGDFNSDPVSAVMNGILGLGYRDTFEIAHPGMTTVEACTLCTNPLSPNFNPMTIAPGQLPAQNTESGDDRIDYILMKSPKATVLASTLIFTETVNNIWMSDHSGVMSTVLLGDDAGTPPSVPNPVRDRKTVGEPSQIIEITDKNLNCDQDGCQHELPQINAASATGVTFVNHSSKSVRVEIDGAAQIFPRNYSLILKDKVASYFFEKGANSFRFWVYRTLSKKKLTGSIQTH
jgi:hypothetical protein